MSKIVEVKPPLLSHVFLGPNVMIVYGSGHHILRVVIDNTKRVAKKDKCQTLLVVVFFKLSMTNKKRCLVWKRLEEISLSLHKDLLMRGKLNQL